MGEPGEFDYLVASPEGEFLEWTRSSDKISTGARFMAQLARDAEALRASGSWQGTPYALAGGNGFYGFMQLGYTIVQVGHGWHKEDSSNGQQGGNNGATSMRPLRRQATRRRQR